MRISICSDLHLEFGSIDITNTEQADVLILSGDIMLGTKPDRFFLEKCAEQFKDVIYIAGNHEFYDGKWNKTISLLREICSTIDGVHFLENDSIKIQDCLFIGCTLWTDMNKGDAVTMYNIRNMLSDYRTITFDGDGFFRRLIPDDTVERHFNSKQFILDQISKVDVSEKVVVVGHHAPSKASTHPRYIDEVIVNGAYSSDLSDFILDHPQIKLWTHGHTHEPFDYMIGSTRIVCNPRGYIGYEDRADKFQLKTIEV